jgi:hypothetical protein
LHDNQNIDLRCRTLWADIQAALEKRITSVNGYVPEKRSHIVCEHPSEESIHLHQASSERSVIANLDLNKHAIHIREFRDRALEHPTSRKDMPLSMLADGEVYVTDGNELKANAMEVAKALIEALLSTKQSQISA